MSAPQWSGSAAVSSSPSARCWPNGDIGYNQFWIVFGLIAWAASAVTGILFLGPEAKRLNKAAEAHGPKSPEVQDRLRRILLVVRMDVALMFLIVFDMVVKPFS
jgi:uncharacterized membrane protein